MILGFHKSPLLPPSWGSDGANALFDNLYLQYSVNSDICQYLMADHKDTPMTDKVTYRLAVVNMDWDHIKVCNVSISYIDGVLALFFPANSNDAIVTAKKISKKLCSVYCWCILVFHLF